MKGIELLDGLRKDSRDAFQELHNRYYNALYYYARGFLTDIEESRSAVHDAFLKVWMKRQDFESENNIKYFLYVTVRNACLNIIDHRDRRQQVFDARSLEDLPEPEQASFEREMIKAEVMREVYAEIGKLSPRCRMVIQLLLVEGLTTGQVAARLHIALSSVQNHKRKGLKILRSKLDKDLLRQFHKIFLLCMLFYTYSRN